MLRTDVRTARVFLLALLAFCPATLSGCSEDLTEIVLVVDTNMATDIDEVVVTATNGEGVVRTATNTVGGIDDARFPITVGLVPGDNKSTSLTVSVVASNNHTTVMRAEAATRFVEGRRLLLRLSLPRECVEAGADTCGSGMTCRPDEAYSCGSSEVDPSTLSEWNGSLLQPDGGTQVDMPSSDMTSSGDANQMAMEIQDR